MYEFDDYEDKAIKEISDAVDTLNKYSLIDEDLVYILNKEMEKRGLEK